MAGIGRWTASDLGDAERLFIPRADDVPLLNAKRTGNEAPVLSRQALRLSTELAAAAYSFDVDPWLDAGWQDISFQVDNTLLSGESLNPLEPGLWHGAVSEWMQYLARSRAQRRNVVNQYRGIRRQTEGEADTCKALVMLRPVEDGNRFVVAVGFMGTVRRLYDWISNLRVKPEDGIHQGFLQLTREFMDNAPKILFPKTARTLGLSTLSLKDILDEMKAGNSRFKLWAAGHSQGGAVLQVFFDALLQGGVKKENLCGFGFASPSVASEKRAADMLQYPITHIINADDITPRVGALEHLGSCLIFTPDDATRARFYRTMWQDDCFRETMGYVSQIRDTRQAILFAAALLNEMSALPAEELRPILAGMLGRFLPEKLIAVFDQKLDSGLSFIRRRVETAYAEVFDGPMTPSVLSYYVGRDRDLLARFGPIRFFRCLAEALALPHKLVAENDGRENTAPYLYIALRGFDELSFQPALSSSVPVWTQPRVSAAKPRRLGATRFAGLSALRDSRK